MDLVEAASDPAVRSLAEAAAQAGVGRTSAHRMVRSETVSAEIAKRRVEKLDKARGSAAKLQRATAKLLAKLDDTLEKELSPFEIGGLLKIALDAQRTVQELGIGGQDGDVGVEVFKRYMDRVARLAYRRGYDDAAAGRPQDMVLSPAPLDVAAEKA